MSKPKPIVVFDIECYRDFFLVYFRSVTNGKEMAYDAYPGKALDCDAITRILRNCVVVSFNGNHYDLPMLTLALTGVSCSALKDASDAIIEENLNYWDFERKYGIRIPGWIDHIDLIEVAPGQGSLKIYGGRLHCQRLQDLPIEPSALISEEDRVALTLYCGNDLQTTIDLYEFLKPQIALREAMSIEYDRDLRSKSDAQIAEAVLRDQVSKSLGYRVQKPSAPLGAAFSYVTPPIIRFVTQQLREVLGIVEATEFRTSEAGKLLMPKELSDLKIEIGSSVYRMGIGGLHSSEATVSHVADADTLLVDRDVTSYYPSIIIGTELFPSHLGKTFLEEYQKILVRRVTAKRAGDKVTAEALKIVLNGSFGKFGSKWSVLYSPSLLIQTTIGGQLLLLMLIEALELEGIPVVSANTDGIVIKCPAALKSTLDGVVCSWELFTGLGTEETEYAALYSRDVNNYLALKTGGGYKAKGAYASPGLQKNPSNAICVEAVATYLEHGTRISDTVNDCVDVRKFITIRKVAGGGMKGETFLGKAVRWYYAKGEEGVITYKTNGNIVARSEGARPLMDLPTDGSPPPDLDRGWYVDEAYRILNDIGFKHEPVKDE